MGTGALPTAPTMIGTDPDAQKEYFDALNQALKALEGRQETNWWNVAAGFAKPTRSGSFGESLGNVAETLGKQQEEQEARAPAIAQMRAALAGQKFQTAQEVGAQNILLNALGGQNLGEVAQQFATPEGAIADPSLVMRLARAQQLTPPGTRAAEQLKGLIDTQMKMLDFGIKSNTLTNDQIKTYNEGLKTQFQTGITPILPNVGGRQPQPATAAQAPAVGQPATNTTQVAAPNTIVPREAVVNALTNMYDLKSDQLSSSRSREEQQALYDRWKAGDKSVFTPVNPADYPDQKVFHANALDVPRAVPEKFMNSLGWYRPNPEKDPVHYEPMKPGAVSGAVENKPSALVPESAQKDILAQKEFERQQLEKAESAREAPAADSLKELATIKEGDLADNRGVFKTATNILNDPKMEDAFGLLFKQPGVASGLATMARDGVKVGPFGLSVDVYDGLIKQLSPYQQNKLRQLDMALSQIFVQKAQAMKSAFGPQISNADIIKEEKTMASVRDPVNIIKGFILRENTRNDHRLDLSRAYHDYINKTSGTTDRPYKFLSSPEYRRINDDYNTRYSDISNIISNSVQ